MNIDFELYRIFNEVALTGNITAASERLHISQPAVSKSIKLLENQLGGNLFVRTKRGVILTEEGKELHKYIKTAIEYIRSAENKFADMINLDTGLLRIGISKTLVEKYLLPYLSLYHSKYPNIKIEIVTDMTSVLISKLKNGLIDLIITNLSTSTYQDMELTHLKEIQDIFVINKNFKMDKYKLNLDELNNYPLILQPKGNNTRDFLDNFLAKYNIIVNPEISLASYSLVEDITKIGYGIGYVVREYVEEDIKSGELVEIETEPKIPSRFIGMLTMKNSIPSFAAKELINLLIKK